MISSEAQREKISFVIPCYNSTNTIGRVVQEIKEVMNNSMNKYDYD